MIILEIVAGALGFVYQMEVVGHSVCYKQCPECALYYYCQGDFVAVRATSAFDEYTGEDNDVTTLVDFMQGEVIHIIIALQASHLILHIKLTQRLIVFLVSR